MVERICRSFRKMKEQQRAVDRRYLPSDTWQATLDDGYAHMLKSVAMNNLRDFHLFLANFGCWERSLGFEGGYLIRKWAGSFLTRSYAQDVLFLKPLSVWQWYYGHRRPTSALESSQRIGNQAGAFIDGVFCDPNAFFNEIYGSLLSGLVADLKRPTIADLGGGSGKTAAYMLRNLKEFTYVDFDLPEVLCVAAYYLMSLYPEKRTLLYGEGDYSSTAHKNYDLIFMPSFEIEKAGALSIDLFVNRVSLGEMTQLSAFNYVKFILAASRRFFFHMNHDGRRSRYLYEAQERGPLAYQYPIPETDFRLQFRYPELGHMLRQGFLDFDEDVFMFLYERRERMNTGDVPFVRSEKEIRAGR